MTKTSKYTFLIYGMVALIFMTSLPTSSYAFIFQRKDSNLSLPVPPLPQIKPSIPSASDLKSIIPLAPPPAIPQAAAPGTTPTIPPASAPGVPVAPPLQQILGGEPSIPPAPPPAIPQAAAPGTTPTIPPASAPGVPVAPPLQQILGAPPGLTTGAPLPPVELKSGRRAKCTKSLHCRDLDDLKSCFKKKLYEPKEGEEWGERLYARIATAMKKEVDERKGNKVFNRSKHKSCFNEAIKYAKDKKEDQDTELFDQLVKWGWITLDGEESTPDNALISTQQTQGTQSSPYAAQPGVAPGAQAPTYPQPGVAPATQPSPYTTQPGVVPGSQAPAYPQPGVAPATQPSPYTTQPGVVPGAQAPAYPQPGVAPATQPGVQPSVAPAAQPAAYAQPNVMPGTQLSPYAVQPSVMPEAQPSPYAAQPGVVPGAPPPTTPQPAITPGPQVSPYTTQPDVAPGAQAPVYAQPGVAPGTQASTYAQPASTAGPQAFSSPPGGTPAQMNLDPRYGLGEGSVPPPPSRPFRAF